MQYRNKGSNTYHFKQCCSDCKTWFETSSDEVSLCEQCNDTQEGKDAFKAGEPVNHDQSPDWVYGWLSEHNKSQWEKDNV